MRIVALENNKLKLKNNGELSLFFIGVGSAFTKKLYQSNLLIIKGDDHILIDCGTKTPQALFELGIPITDINNYYITHSHADHIGGLEEVMLMNRYVKKQKANIIINQTYQNILWDMSLRGGSAFNEEYTGNILTFGDMWNIQRPVWLKDYPRETYEANLGSINLKFFRTMHIPDGPQGWNACFWSSGVLIDEKILFTSDTRFDKDLLSSFQKKFDIEAIFHDCQLFTGGVHASIDELKTLDQRTKKKMFLLHYGDNWEKFEDKVIEYGFKGFAKQWVYYNFSQK